MHQLIYRLKRPFHFLKTGLGNGLPAQIRYGWPARKLTTIAITGTDGKTTSSTMLYHVLKTAGYKVALLSTVAAYIGDEEIDTGFHVTSPAPSDLQRFMRRMVDQGYEYLILEVTSHGVYQYRNWGVTPSIVGLTNITNEHLDYFLTYENYVAAKALLLNQAPTVVLNADDNQSFQALKKHLKPTKKVVTYTKSEKLPASISQAITTRFKEAYNQSNARLVTTLSTQLGVKPELIAKGITSFAGIPGRMQEIAVKAPFTVIVDFAHTPNALASALTALRKKINLQNTTTNQQGRLIAVFGCAGLRDHTKRSPMGKTAATIADIAVFTAEDPRTENVWSIIRQMKEWLTTEHSKVISIAHRQEALTFTLRELAQPGDIIGIFGKGHEQSMCYGTTEYPWNDAIAVTEILTPLQPARNGTI